MKSWYVVFLVVATIANAADDWQQKFPANHPPARDGHGLAYIGSDNILLFGGSIITDPYYLNDTWLYDLGENTWTELHPSGELPAIRCGHTMTYLGNNDDKVLLFGGMSDEGIYADTWIYDLSENTWTELQPAGDIPDPRIGHSMVYCANDVIVLFGGQNWDEEYFNDTYIYNYTANTWTLQSATTPPTGKSSHGAARIDSEHLVIFGGYTYNDEWGAAMEDDSTWVYSIPTATWTNMKPEGENPDPRTEQAMVYLNSDQVLMYGGFLSTFCHNDSWVYDFSDNSWTRDTNSVNPYARRSHKMTETSLNGTTYPFMFGGNDVSGMAPIDESWTFGGGDYLNPSDLEAEPEILHSFRLYPNFPNPFNPLTQINFELPNSTTINLSVFDTVGRHIETLVKGRVGTGKHTVTWNAQHYPAGVYYLRLQSSTTTAVRKMTLIK